MHELAADPEPDGRMKELAPEGSKHAGCILADAYPWLITYQLVGPNRLIVIAIEIHPRRAIFM